MVQNFPKLKPPCPSESCRGGDRFQWIKAVPAKKDDNPVALIQVTGGADIADANLYKIQLTCWTQLLSDSVQTGFDLKFWVWTIGEETFFGSDNRRIQSFGADSLYMQAVAIDSDLNAIELVQKERAHSTEEKDQFIFGGGSLSVL